MEVNYLLIFYSKSLIIQYSVHFARFCVLLLYPYVYITTFIFRWIISDHPYSCSVLKRKLRRSSRLTQPYLTLLNFKTGRPNIVILLNRDPRLVLEPEDSDVQWTYSTDYFNWVDKALRRYSTFSYNTYMEDNWCVGRKSTLAILSIIVYTFYQYHFCCTTISADAVQWGQRDPCEIEISASSPIA